MNNSVRIDYSVNGKIETFWFSIGTLDEIDNLRKKLEDTILNSPLWEAECPMKGRGCQCSAREKCIHYRKQGCPLNHGVDNEPCTKECREV